MYVSTISVHPSTVVCIYYVSNLLACCVCVCVFVYVHVHACVLVCLVLLYTCVFGIELDSSK